MAKPEPLLEVSDLNGYYGTAHVLQDVSFQIGSEPTGIIGRNGMGKTTLCLALMGLLPSARGSVRFEGQELLGKPAYKVAAAGLGLVPQGRRLFPSLTAEEHLRLVAGRRNGGGWTIERVYELFLASPSAGAPAAWSSRAVSSRCWRSLAPCSSTPSS